MVYLCVLACWWISIISLKLLVVASSEDDIQEHLNHRGEHPSTRNQIATAQYECFQRMGKESQRKTKTIGERIVSKSLWWFLMLLLSILSHCNISLCCLQGQCATQRGMGGCAGMKLNPDQRSRAVRTTLKTLILRVNFFTYFINL